MAALAASVDAPHLQSDEDARAWVEHAIRTVLRRQRRRGNERRPL